MDTELPLELKEGDYVILEAGRMQKVAKGPQAHTVRWLTAGSQERPHVRLMRVEHPDGYAMTHQVDLLARDVLSWNWDDE